MEKPFIKPSNLRNCDLCGKEILKVKRNDSRICQICKNITCEECYKNPLCIDCYNKLSSDNKEQFDKYDKRFSIKVDILLIFSPLLILTMIILAIIYGLSSKVFLYSIIICFGTIISFICYIIFSFAFFLYRLENIVKNNSDSNR